MSLKNLRGFINAFKSITPLYSNMLIYNVGSQCQPQVLQKSILPVSCNNCNLVNKKLFSTSRFLSAGHAKWQNIKHIKAAKDKERGDVFQRYSKLISLAAKDIGGANPSLNSKLARIIDAAKKHKMPNTTIEKALKQAESQSADAKPHTVVMVGSGAIYVVIDVVTSKLTRSRQLLISMCRKLGLREDRSPVTTLYEEKGVLITTGDENKLSEAMDHAIECGAEDVTYDEGYLTFTCDPMDYIKVKKELENLNYEIEYGDVDKLPLQIGTVKETDAQYYRKLIDKIEAMDEVTRVQINFDL